ncbi:MAG: LLM class flavin-dependent oxidoreductase [Acidimicrobiia bacterium]|nr:LLM class flavin-dependent oxidoreductase [Acidimicrobiia bacterium]
MRPNHADRNLSGLTEAVKVGMCLPTFSGDPGLVATVATTAERAGLDGLFVFDHLLGGGGRAPDRPAMELSVALAQVAAVTEGIAVGPLVARAGLRTPQMTAHLLATIERIAPGRLIAGLGAGDSQSQTEYATFGFSTGSIADRMGWMARTSELLLERGIPVGIGSTHPDGIDLAAAVGGWNCWEATADVVRSTVENFKAAGLAVEASWSGSVILKRSRDEAEELWAGRADRTSLLWGDPVKLAADLGPFARAGADWVILSPLETTAATVELVAEVRGLLRRASTERSPDQA